MNKKELRAQIKAKKSALTEQQIVDCSSRLAQQLFALRPLPDGDVYTPLIVQQLHTTFQHLPGGLVLLGL